MNDFFSPEKETWLYHVNPAFKFIIMFSFLLIILFNRQLVFTFSQTILSILLLIFFSGYPLKKLFLLSIPATLSFLSSVLSMALFGKGEIIWWQWGLLKISKESFFNGLLLGTKALNFGVVALLILLTTRPILLLYGLMQQYKLKPTFAYSFIASIQLMPIIIEELQLRNNAFKIRGLQFPRGIKGGFERMKLFAIPLFAQSIRRAQRIAIAMEAKRFQMNKARTFYYVTNYSKFDLIFSSLILFGFVLSILLASYLGNPI